MSNPQSSPVLTSQQAIEEYVDDLITTKKSPYVNESNRAEVKKMLMEEVNATINRKLISKLTDSEVDELNKLLEAKATDEKLAEFFNQKIPDLNKVVLEALIDFRRGYLAVNYQEQKPATISPAAASSSSDSPLPAPVAQEKEEKSEKAKSN